MRKYETNLEPALKTTAPKGVISRKKLLELFKGVGIELKEEIALQIVGLLATRSESIEHLQYNILFER